MNRRQYKNISIIASLIILVSLLILFDHQRLQSDFFSLTKKMRNIRLKSIIENKTLIIKFDGSEVSVLDYKKGERELLETFEYGTIGDVSYDTKIGNDMIVFHGGAICLAL